MQSGNSGSSYIQGNLSQAGPLSLQSLIIHLCVVFLLTPIHQFILVGILGLLLYEVCAINRPLVLHHNKWIVASLWIYTGSRTNRGVQSKVFLPALHHLRCGPDCLSGDVVRMCRHQSMPCAHRVASQSGIVACLGSSGCDSMRVHGLCRAICSNGRVLSLTNSPSWRLAKQIVIYRY